VISDDDLRRAAQRWEETRLKQLPEPEGCRFEASPEFGRKMKKLIERADHPTKYWLKKGFACLLMVIFLGGGGALTLSSEAKAAFFGWTREVFATFFEYRYTGESAPSPESAGYLPTWIPDGFELTDEIHKHTGGDIYYEDTEGQLILFSYSAYNEGTNLQITGDNIDIQMVHVGKYRADFYLDQDEGENNALVWADEDRKVLFQIFAPFSGDELVKMAESITEQ